MITQKCPYCGKKLEPKKVVLFGDTYVYICKNDNCCRSSGMVGTLEMWAKVESLAKIRAANRIYRKRCPISRDYINAYRRNRYANDPEYREKEKQKVIKYRQTERFKEHHREYMREYYHKKKLANQ